MSVIQDAQGQLRGLQPSSHTGPGAQKGPTLGLMLYCPHFEVLNNFFIRGLHFQVVLRPANYRASSGDTERVIQSGLNGERNHIQRASLIPGTCNS